MGESLTLRRSGAFNCALKGDSHCGVKGGASETLQMKYTVHARCATVLDDRGFLFEQLGVDDFFSGITETELSCEQLAMDCAEKLAVMIIKENPRISIERLEVEISPYPFNASMRYEYVPDHTAPFGMREPPKMDTVIDEQIRQSFS